MSSTQSLSAQPSSVEDLLALLKECWNRHDMMTYTAQFAGDAVYVNALGVEWRGHAEIERNHVRMHEKIFRNSTMTRMTSRVQSVAPGVSVAVCNWEMTGSDPPDGWAMGHPREGVMMLLLAQQDGRWRIMAGQNTEKRKVAGEQ